MQGHTGKWAIVTMGVGLILLAVVAGSRAQDRVPNEPLIVDLANADLTLVGEENGDWAGYFASPAGDVNGDGLGDLLVGAPIAGNKECPYPIDPGEVCETLPKGEGVAYLVLGRPKNQFPAAALSLADADASFVGCENFSMTARQLYTAGDVNGDGYDDMIISGWKCGEWYTGKAYLILGRPDVATWGRYYPIEQADASFLGENEWDFLSYYVSTAGDVNADGLDDVLITSTHYDITATEVITNVGKMYLVLGRQAADWGANFDLAQADATFLGEAEQDRIGRSATGVGDVNGDGYGDFMVGSISSDYGGIDAGQNYLFLGRAAPGDPNYDPSRPWWGHDFSVAGADASFVGETPGDESGRRVAGAGDVNGDGLDDVIIGAARHDFAGDWSGVAHLVLGRSEADWGLRFWLGNADASFVGEAKGDQAGRRLSGAGDVNGDGYDDVIIGAPHNNRGGRGAGASYLIYGRAAVDWGTHYSLGMADIVHVGKPEIGVAGYDQGWLGDFSGDGIDDYLIAAYGGRNNQTVPGEVYVMLGSDRPRPYRFTPDTPARYDTWRRFDTEYWDANGWQDVEYIQLVVGRQPTDTLALNVRYRAAQNAVSLWDSSRGTWVGPCVPGEDRKLASPTVRLDCALTSIGGSGSNIIAAGWGAAWAVPMPGTAELHAWLRSVDVDGHDSGLVEFPWPTDVAIKLSAVPTNTIEVSAALTYVLAFGNAGGTMATGVVVTDAIPAEMADVQVESSVPITPVAGATYAWQVGNLAPLHGGVITLTGTIDPLHPGRALTNTATIAAVEPDAISNNRDRHVLVVRRWQIYLPVISRTE